MHSVAAEYPHSTLKGTRTCISHTGTVLYETHMAGQEESACVELYPSYSLATRRYQ